MKQSYRCSTKACSNETRHSMPNVKWLQVEAVRCEKCGRLIIFSTLYQPEIAKEVKYASDLP